MCARSDRMNLQIAPPYKMALKFASYRPRTCLFACVHQWYTRNYCKSLHSGRTGALYTLFMLGYAMFINTQLNFHIREFAI